MMVGVCHSIVSGGVGGVIVGGDGAAAAHRDVGADAAAAAAAHREVDFFVRFCFGRKNISCLSRAMYCFILASCCAS